MTTTDLDYQIIHHQGDTFKLTFNYLDENDAAIDLTGCTAEMHIKRSPLKEEMVCRVLSDHPNGAFGISGSKDFGITGGVTAGTGGIILNYQGVTGSIFVEIDSATTTKIPAKRNFCSLHLILSGSVEERVILDGTFEVAKEVTT